MSNGHYFLAASFAPVWGRCAGAAQLAAMYPQEDTDQSREGTAIHWYAAQRMLGVPGPHDKDPAGTILTDEMRQAANVFVRDVRSVVEKAAPGYVWRVEQQGRASIIHPEHCGGSTDVFLWEPDRNRLTVWDAKFGHKWVSEFENLQLIIYVAILLEVLGIDGHREQSVTVDMRICQPRTYNGGDPTRSWVVPATELRGYYNQLAAQAAEALSGNARTVSGPHCYYCPARHVCEASRKATYASIEYVGRAVPEQLTPDIVSFELQLLERAKQAVEGRLTMMRQQGEAFTRAGQVVPGYGMRPTASNLKWTQPEEMVRALGQAYGVKIIKETPITPTQAIDAGIDEAVIKAYAARTSGVTFDKIDTDAIRRVFGTNP